MNLLGGVNQKLVTSFLKNAMEKNKIKSITIFYDEKTGEISFKSFTEDILILPKNKLNQKSEENGIK